MDMPLGYATSKLSNTEETQVLLRFQLLDTIASGEEMCAIALRREQLALPSSALSTYSGRHSMSNVRAVIFPRVPLDR